MVILLFSGYVDVVISDLHIGNLGSTFSSAGHRGVTEQFVRELKEIDTVERLILLGDVFDFWDENLFKAVDVSSSFFEKISGITKEIIYIPGNHDHHSLILCEEMENIRKMEGEAAPSFQHALRYEYPKREHSDSREAKLLRGLLPALEDIHIQLVYPEYRYTWKGKEILFRHGHYLDSGLFIVMVWIFEHFGGRITSEKDFEVVNTPLYEHFYRCGAIKEINIFYKRLHRIFKRFEKIYKKNTHKNIENRRKDIEKFFAKFKGAHYPDVLVFGHTHVADKGIVNTMEVFNSGCWVKEENIPHCNTYITIDDEINVRKVGKGVIF